MIRRLVAGLIVVGLAVGIWALWPRGDSGATSTTLPVAVETTTTTTVADSTTVAGTTNSTEDSSYVVTSVEEAEEILRELWFGWFEGIYNQDEERIKEVVGTQAMLDQGQSVFDEPFSSTPSREQILFSGTEILRADNQCLAVWTTMDVSAFRGEGATSQDLVVIRHDGAKWKLATTWAERNELWEADCESQLEPLS